jgi:hypothetical protein
MKRILAFGDSFVVGDQDDFGPQDFNYNPEYPPTHNMSYDDRLEYLKNHVSFVALLAKEFNCALINFAERGCGNYVQLDKLLEFIEEGRLEQGDLILFGITSTLRDRNSVPSVDGNYPIAVGEMKNKGYVDRFDLFYILSALDAISKRCNVSIIKFNLFDNPMCNSSSNLNFNFENFIGFNLNANTLVNILNDDWGADISRPVYHTQIKPGSNYKQYYTWNKHPSVLGHKKIAEWFLKNIKWP